MIIGNSIKLSKPENESATLFKIDSVRSFIDCVSTLAHHVRERKRKHVLIISDEKYHYEKVRAAYFCWLKEEFDRAGHTGESIPEMHQAYKAEFLLPILCRENQDFADLVLKVANEGDDTAIVNLLSVADGSICTAKILGEYFQACKGSVKHGGEK